MALKPFKDCLYSAFCSHAHADDVAWREWITDFCYELEIGLSARVKGKRVPKLFMTTVNPIVAGRLNEKLALAVKMSFAMFIFVHDNYIESPYCLKELEFFRECFGDAGPRERLYIVSMSEVAMELLRDKRTWGEVMPEDVTYAPFWSDDHHDQPIPVYTTDNRRGRKIIVDTEFWERFVRIREDLASKMNAAIREEERGGVTYPTNAPTAAEPSINDLVKVYIEGNESQAYFEGLSKQVVTSWDRVVAQEHVEPKLYLRPTGLDLGDIDKRPALTDADGMILLWARKAPDSLVAQINMVEPKLKGPNAAPGLVAYLMTDRDDRAVPATINNWPVVRFLTIESDGSATPLADDEPILTGFLSQVLKHHLP